MKNNQGFTLVEILTSILLLCIVGGAFFQFFILSQKTTTESKEKLVAVNLAQSVLEQIKTKEYIEIPDLKDIEVNDFPKVYTIDNACSSNNQDCIDRYKKTINNSTYFIEIEVNVNQDADLPLLEITVNVFNENSKQESSVKGLIRS